MATQNQPRPQLAQFEPRQSFGTSFQLFFVGVEQVRQCPFFQVPPGATVTLRPIGGSGLNAGIVFLANNPEALNGNGSAGLVILLPGIDVTLPWPVDNTGSIWMKGSGPDGVLVLVQSTQIG